MNEQSDNKVNIYGELQVGSCLQLYFQGLICCLFQGDIPWDSREFRMCFLGTVAFWTTITYYFVLRDGSREVTWKDFVNNYLSKGVVRRTPVI